MQSTASQQAAAVAAVAAAGRRRAHRPHMQPARHDPEAAPTRGTKEQVCGVFSFLQHQRQKFEFIVAEVKEYYGHWLRIYARLRVTSCFFAVPSNK